MAKIVIKISQVIGAEEDLCDTQADNLSVKVSLSSHIDSIPSRPNSLSSHPCLRSAIATLTLPDFEHDSFLQNTRPSREEHPIKFQHQVSWLLEEHLAREPLATKRADHVRQLIYEHGLRLKRELGIIEEDLEKHAIDEVVFDIHDGNHTRMLLWEVLESPDLWYRQLLICTRRSVSQNLTPTPVKRKSTNPPVRSKLNILLLVARKPADNIDHQLTSRLLVEMLETKPSLKERIELKICRPGSKDALVHALQQNDYDILHLDLHGNIDDQGPCLLFQSSNLNSPDWVRASEVAAIISQNRIGLVVINACKSAQHSGDEMQNSLAASLVQSGVSHVVGMSYEISDQAVKVFHRAFYEALLDGGKDVASAVSFARSALQHDNSRESAMFGSKVFINDYIVPVVYHGDGQHPLRSLPSSTSQHINIQDYIGRLQTETLAAKSESLYVGRNAKAFDIENKLLQNGVALVEGPFGIGKRRLMDNLASWFQKSGLVRATYKLDFSEGDMLQNRCLELCLQQYVSYVPPGAITEHDPSNSDPKSMMDLFNRQPSILLIFDINSPSPWVKTLVEEFASAGRKEGIPASFLLISSTASLEWLADGLIEPICKLGAIDRASAMQLLRAHINAPLTSGLSIGPSLPALETEGVSPALWYYFQLLALLGYNPLAIELASGLLVTTSADELLWQFQIDKITLDWVGNKRLRRLASNWTHLISRWGTLMLALIPCQLSISGPLFTALFSSINQDPSRTMSTFVESLVAAEAVSMVGRKGGYDSFQLLNLHPLLCQYIRHQQWDKTHLRKIWLNVATFYHNESLKWISTGLYSSKVINECRREWQNLMATLRYLVCTDIGGNTPESSLFDLPWLVCSFMALNATTSRIEKDVFLGLTVSALQELSLDFQITESYPWQLIFEAGVRKNAQIIPEQKIMRICLTCLHLVQSFYDASEVTAQDYNRLLLMMLRTLDMSSFDHDVSKFMKTVLCFSMLISDELDVEDGIADFGNKTHQYMESEGLETSFTTFSKTWNQTHLYRSLGYHSNLKKTRETIQSIARHLPKPEVQTQLESLEDLECAFGAINGDIGALNEAVKTLEERLLSTTTRNDTRRQLDLYEKLVELYTKRNDWRAVIFVLDKIDELSQDMAQFPGVRSDEISFLKRQRWMLARRAVCLKRLGSIEKSKDAVKQLREIVDRRERLWTKTDRNKEEQRNLMAAFHSRLADRHDGNGISRELNIGDHAFMLQRYYNDDDPALVDDSPVMEHISSNQNTEDISSTEVPVNTSLSTEIIESWSNDLLGSQTTRFNQQQAGDIQSAHSRLASLQSDDDIPAAASPSAQDAHELDAHSDSIQPDRSDAELQQYPDDYDYENKDDDADNLYFVLNPWMIQPCKALRQFTLRPGGGREVQRYKDFQMPPGHVGGYFLIEGKRLVAEHYLRLLGVKPEVS